MEQAMVDRDTLTRMLELARWAPSGDNTQPWRFEIVDEGLVLIHGFDTRDQVVYDFEGHASQIAHGALLETLRIAASGLGCATSWRLRPESSDRQPVFELHVSRAPGGAADPLFPYIERRVVQRRPMRTTPLTPEQRRALAAAAGESHEVRFFESFAERVTVARLLWDNAYIRLTCPEAFEVHREVIEWGARYSTDRIPEQAVGVDPLTARLMRWVMQSWGRVDFFNKYLMGTVAPRIQLDVLPALGCAAHLFVVARRPPSSMLDYVEAGIAMQRVWLTAHALGLHLQPEMTPVIFKWYATASRSLSVKPGIDDRVRLLSGRLAALLGNDAASGLVVMCRVGSSAPPASRSTRKALADLMTNRSGTELR
jgi:nitroreductase